VNDDCRRLAGDLLDQAIRDRVFPAAIVEVGASDRTIWRAPFGTLSFAPGSPFTTNNTIFDLASLAKPIATATLAVSLLQRGRLALDEPVSSCFEEWRGRDREEVTVRDLLEHSSGLPARLVDAPPETRREFVHEICAIALEYPPRSRSIYSDLGFILLGFLVEDRGGASLASQFLALRPLFGAGDEGDGVLGFDVPPGARARTAPTRPLDTDVRRGRMLTGEVQDNYAAQLGGAAGHAGLFGNAPAVGRFAHAMLLGARGDMRMRGPFSPDAVRLATAKSAVPGSSRALGWDTMLPTSSCGTRLSAAAFGHVGFTGTSLWIDPERDRYFVLLTNRVAGPGTLEQIRTVRRSFHDIVATIDD
jgi:CubicO group peptidase (beta-lactamase class C family)